MLRAQVAGRLQTVIAARRKILDPLAGFGLLRVCDDKGIGRGDQGRHAQSRHGADIDRPSVGPLCSTSNRISDRGQLSGRIQDIN